MLKNLEIRLLEFGSPEQRASVELRRAVLRLPLGMDFPVAELANEDRELHVAAFLGEELAGILLLRPLGSGLGKMRQVAVREELQGLGIGAALVRFVEAEARARGFREIELNAREPVCPFYEKLGYAREGGRFTEVGLPHWRMRKVLE